MSDPIVFDKAKWHSGGEFPDDLDEDQAFVHTGLFLGWVIDTGLCSQEFTEDSADEIGEFTARKMTGPGVYESVDGVFMDEMLNPEGIDFAIDYFDFEQGKYLSDYETVLLGDLPTMYHVQDTWENYNLLKPQIDKRFAAWRKKRGSA